MSITSTGLTKTYGSWFFATGSVAANFNPAPVGFILSPTTPVYSCAGSVAPCPFSTVSNGTISVGSFQNTPTFFIHFNPISGLPTDTNLSLKVAVGTQGDCFIASPATFASCYEQAFYGDTVSLDAVPFSLASGATANSPSAFVTDNNYSGTPPTVPEPGTFVLLASGLIGLAVCERRLRLRSM